MTSALTAATYRLPIRNLVFQRVYHVLRTYPQFTQLRQRFPVPAPTLVTSWRTYATSVRDNTTTTATAWVSSWAPSWLLPQAAGGAPSGGSAGEPLPARDPKRLTERQLLDMLDNSSMYVVHRTTHSAAGTCAAPLLAEHDPYRKKNPTAPPGIYVTRGISGFADYGPYGVVFTMAAVLWTHHEGPDFRYNGDELDTSLATGYYYEDDLKKAMALRQG